MDKRSNPCHGVFVDAASLSARGDFTLLWEGQVIVKDCFDWWEIKDQKSPVTSPVPGHRTGDQQCGWPFILRHHLVLPNGGTARVGQPELFPLGDQEQRL